MLGYFDRINRLRQLMLEQGFDGYLIPTSDEYLSEYTPVYAKRLEYMTSFTGSNGLAIILQDSALFFTDGRYIQQAEKELDLNIFQVFNQGRLIDFAWQNYCDKNAVVGYDPKLFTRSFLKHFRKLCLQPYSPNLVDIIWDEQPSRPKTLLYEYPNKFAGEEYFAKVLRCQEYLTHHQADILLITALDSIAWILNLRASDINFSPLFLAKLIITRQGVYLYTDLDRLENNLLKKREAVKFKPEKSFEEDIKNLRHFLNEPKDVIKVVVDKQKCSNELIGMIESDNQLELIDYADPCQDYKACKTLFELQHAINRHINDGVAVCELLADVTSNIYLANWSEYDIGVKLSTLRAQQKDYVMDSFPTICGFQENSSIIHYRAKQDNCKKLSGEGILLIDSGGQYYGATTDVTRTIVIGEPTEQQKEQYTRVLKGHIALASVIFPIGTSGANLDVLARQYLWQIHADYPHGTGHGVGSFLSVHEGPQSINRHNNVELKEGMIISNEPGYYIPGRYGIRIENLLYIANSTKPGYLRFINLTLVPYCQALLKKQLLTDIERHYISEYYQQIKEVIYPLLSDRAKLWLLQEINNL